MTDVAEYINEMKRLHENAVKVQEIISNIAYLDVRCRQTLFILKASFNKLILKEIYVCNL